ncbi:hypothetical protein ASG25_21065 [Rhizobium sp. Leaf384]|uniref:hypothetical protein n=1 Tax=unclassified Rhizobium TaxID=2613769 RepID=UPI000715E529|nr:MULTISPECIES: hypothetical protein [unclassified Rhizobium]KQS75242.1 hypothetical protein ASG25_21065 [Rhizobium sp. Leaf384]KQS85567.1 hypothetical protein ASG58_19340 [Rhizobium sp. Leaf383]
MNRKLYLASLMGCLLAIAPVRPALDRMIPFDGVCAFAKGGNNGGGGNGGGNNGGGNGGGNSSGGNNGGGNNGGGNNGGGNSGSSGGGNSNGSSNGSSNGGRGKSGSAGSSNGDTGASAPASSLPAFSRPDADGADGQALSIRHRNGFREQLTGDRYVMRDAQGRIVVDRRATRADRERLRRLAIR